MAMLGYRDPLAPLPLDQSQTLASPTFTGDPVTDTPTLPVHHKLNFLGILADALSGAAGQQGMYAQHQYENKKWQQQLDYHNQEYQRERADHRADTAEAFRQQLGLFDYKRLHPDDNLDQQLDAAGITDPVERQKYHRMNVERMTAPPMMSAPGTDEQGNPVMRFFPRAPATPQVISQLPPGAVPLDGGPTPPASGTFR